MASELWQRLRAVRRYADLRQEDVRQVTGVSRSAVAQWEAEDPQKRTIPSIDQVKAIAKLASIPLEWLLNDNANLDDIWQIGKLSAPAPVPVSDRIADAFIKAVEFELLTKRPELAAGFSRTIPMSLLANKIDYWYGRLMVEFKADTKTVAEACGYLLMAERAIGGKISKAVLVYGPYDSNEREAIASTLGIDVEVVTSPAEAADFLIKRA